MTNRQIDKVINDILDSHGGTVSKSAANALFVLATALVANDSLKGGPIELWRAVIDGVFTMRTSGGPERCIPHEFTNAVLKSLRKETNDSLQSKEELRENLRALFPKQGKIQHCENYETILKALPQDAEEAKKALQDLEDLVIN